MTDLINTAAPSTVRPDRAWRKAMGPMPAAVREALLLSSKETLADVWRRVDTACVRAQGIPQYACDARDYLRGEGLSADEARLVVAWIWPHAA